MFPDWVKARPQRKHREARTPMWTVSRCHFNDDSRLKIFRQALHCKVLTCCNIAKKKFVKFANVLYE